MTINKKRKESDSSVQKMLESVPKMIPESVPQVAAPSHLGTQNCYCLEAPSCCPRAGRLNRVFLATTL